MSRSSQIHLNQFWELHIQRFINYWNFSFTNLRLGTLKKKKTTTILVIQPLSTIYWNHPYLLRYVLSTIPIYHLLSTINQPYLLCTINHPYLLTNINHSYLLFAQPSLFFIYCYHPYQLFTETVPIYYLLRYVNHPFLLSAMTVPIYYLLHASLSTIYLNHPHLLSTQTIPICYLL